MKRRYDTEVDRLRAELKVARALHVASKERDEARRERDEARRERDEALSRVAAEAGKDLAGWAADLDAAEAAHARVVAERDEARAEVERLRNDLHVYRAMALDIVLPESSLVRTTETAATAVRDLRRYQAFGPGWDGYAGRVFDAEVVAKAINLVELLVASFQTARTEATEITPCPIADGRIDVEAACEGRRLVVTVAAENDDVGILYEDRGAPHEELVRWNSDDLGRWVRRLTGEDRGALVPIVHEQFDSATATGGDYDEARRERDEAISRVAAEAGKDLAGWAADLDAAEAAHARVVAERDEARAEVDRLRAELKVHALEAELTSTKAALIDAALIHAKLIEERDKLISERRQLRARLVECRPWVGVLPYPNTPEFSEMLAIRDLADDTLEEVQP